MGFALAHPWWWVVSLSWDVDLLISVVAGVSVVAIVAAARAVWVRRRVPRALSQAVVRRRYVEEILAQSTKKTVTSLDVLSPRFAPRFEDSQITSLQDAWAAIQTRGRVRVIIGHADAAITGGAELVGKDIEVRISPSFASENLSYHMFGGENIASTIVNQQDDDKVQPALLDGVGPFDVFRHHFAAAWEASAPLESVIAEQAISRAGRDAGVTAVIQALRDRARLYRLDDTVRAAVAKHAAFRHSSSIIFIVGLPGSGKSFTRRQLAKQLRSLRIQTQELTAPSGSPRRVEWASNRTKPVPLWCLRRIIYSQR